MSSSGTARKRSQKTARPPLTCPTCSKVYVMIHFFKKHLKEKHHMERVELLLESMIGPEQPTKRRKTIKLEPPEPFEWNTTVPSIQGDTQAAVSSTNNSFGSASFHSHSQVDLTTSWPRLQTPFPPLQQTTGMVNNPYKEYHSYSNGQPRQGTVPHLGADAARFQRPVPMLRQYSQYSNQMMPPHPRNRESLPEAFRADAFSPMTPYGGSQSGYPQPQLAVSGRQHQQFPFHSGQRLTQNPQVYHNQPSVGTDFTHSNSSMASSNSHRTSAGLVQHQNAISQATNIVRRMPAPVLARRVQRARILKPKVNLPAISSLFGGGSENSTPGNVSYGYGRQQPLHRPSDTRPSGHGGNPVPPNTFTPTHWGSYQQFDQYKWEQ